MGFMYNDVADELRGMVPESVWPGDRQRRARVTTGVRMVADHGDLAFLTREASSADVELGLPPLPPIREAGMRYEADWFNGRPIADGKGRYRVIFGYSPDAADDPDTARLGWLYAAPVSGDDPTFVDDSQWLVLAGPLSINEAARAQENVEALDGQGSLSIDAVASAVHALRNAA